jgi:hypothetical protein
MRKEFENENRIENRENGANKALLSAGKGASRAKGLGMLCLLAVLLLVAAGVNMIPTFAWHVTNREAGDESGSVRSDSVEASVLPYSLYINEDDGAGNFSVHVYSSNDQAALNSYDAILGRNDYTSAYIHMPLYGVAAGDTLAFTITANGTLANGSNATGVGNNGRNLLLEQYLSNIINLSCGCIPSSTLSATADKETVYSSARSWFEANAASVAKGTFVNYSPGARPGDPVVLNSKSSTMVLRLEPGDYTIESNGQVHVYFRIDYDYPLVDAYISALRLQMGGFKIGEEGHAEFTGVITAGNFDLVSIEMDIE